jgi:hypothetical protein
MLAMTAHQRARRLAYWRGSFIPLSVITILMLLSALADYVTQ